MAARDEALFPPWHRLGGSPDGDSSARKITKYGSPGLPAAGQNDASSTHRWWRELSDICPVSNFPVALLPHPPFNLHLANGVVPVDGHTIVLQVITTGNFSVMGERLNMRQCDLLDAYMKRCKLGPFRISKFLALRCSSSPAATFELNDMCEAAARRLARTRHVQDGRIGRSGLSRPAANIDAPPGIFK